MPPGPAITNRNESRRGSLTVAGRSGRTSLPKSRQGAPGSSATDSVIGHSAGGFRARTWRRSSNRASTPSASRTSLRTRSPAVACDSLHDSHAAGGGAAAWSAGSSDWTIRSTGSREAIIPRPSSTRGSGIGRRSIAPSAWGSMFSRTSSSSENSVLMSDFPDRPEAPTRHGQDCGWQCRATA